MSSWQPRYWNVYLLKGAMINFCLLIQMCHALRMKLGCLHFLLHPLSINTSFPLSSYFILLFGGWVAQNFQRHRASHSLYIVHTLTKKSKQGFFCCLQSQTQGVVKMLFVYNLFLFEMLPFWWPSPIFTSQLYWHWCTFCDPAEDHNKVVWNLFRVWKIID